MQKKIKENSSKNQFKAIHGANVCLIDFQSLNGNLFHVLFRSITQYTLAAAKHLHFVMRLMKRAQGKKDERQKARRFRVEWI